MVARKVLEQLRWDLQFMLLNQRSKTLDIARAADLDEIEGTARAGEVLELCLRQHVVHRVPELVEQRLQVAVRHPRVARVAVAVGVARRTRQVRHEHRRRQLIRDARRQASRIVRFLRFARQKIATACLRD